MIKFITTLFLAVSISTIAHAGSFVELPKVEGVCPAERTTKGGRESAIEAGLSLGKTITGKKAQYLADGIARASNHPLVPVDFIDLYQWSDQVIVAYYKDECLITIGSISGESLLSLHQSFDETVQN